MGGIINTTHGGLARFFWNFKKYRAFWAGGTPALSFVMLIE